MAQSHAATPAPARTGNGRRESELLGGALGNSDSATRRATQLAQNFAYLRHWHLAELGRLLALAGGLLADAASGGSDATVEVVLRVGRAIAVDSISCLRGRTA